MCGCKIPHRTMLLPMIVLLPPLILAARLSPSHPIELSPAAELVMRTLDPTVSPVSPAPFYIFLIAFAVLCFLANACTFLYLTVTDRAFRSYMGC